MGSLGDGYEKTYALLIFYFCPHQEVRHLRQKLQLWDLAVYS